VGGGATPQQIWEYTNRSLTSVPSGAALSTDLSIVANNVSAIKAKTDVMPTAAQIVAAFDADVIDGAYSRIQVERIVAAVLAGSYSENGNQATFTGLNGTTPRLVTTSTTTSKTINSRNGN
jgi:activator of HSP90 ATPase